MTSTAHASQHLDTSQRPCDSAACPLPVSPSRAATFQHLPLSFAEAKHIRQEDKASAGVLQPKVCPNAMRLIHRRVPASHEQLFLYISPDSAVSGSRARRTVRTDIRCSHALLGVQTPEPSRGASAGSQYAFLKYALVPNLRLAQGNLQCGFELPSAHQSHIQSHGMLCQIGLSSSTCRSAACIWRLMALICSMHNDCAELACEWTVLLSLPPFAIFLDASAMKLSF